MFAQIFHTKMYKTETLDWNFFIVAQYNQQIQNFLINFSWHSLSLSVKVINLREHALTIIYYVTMTIKICYLISIKELPLFSTAEQILPTVKTGIAITIMLYPDFFHHHPNKNY